MVTTNLQNLQNSLDQISGFIEEARESLFALNKEFALSDYDNEAFKNFLERPYFIRKIRHDLVEIVIPRFINFRAGWPVRTEGEYVVYRTSQFIDMITPLPEWLRGELGYTRPDFTGTVEENVLTITGNVEEAFKKLGGSAIGSRRGQVIHLKKNKKFSIMRQLVRMGILPYERKPVPHSLLRAARGKIVLRPKQQRDFEKFLEYSSASVFATGGAGKNYFGMYGLDVFAGPKIVVAPTRDILEQWRARLQVLAPHVLPETLFQTYSKDVPKRKFSLAIFEEVQRIPADTGVRAASIDAVCRLGLSATPWREDGQEDLIAALCGLPVGMDWDSGAPPKTTLYLVGQENEKLPLLQKIIHPSRDRKTIIFVYRIEEGNRISKALKIPFFHGGSNARTRYADMQAAPVFVCSKIGDAGISFDVEHVIDYDWLGGRQELGQRLLRTQHSEKESIASLIMTKAEYQSSSNQNRLAAAYALGCDVKVI